MTRRERAIRNSKQKAEKTRQIIFTLLSGLYADEYRKKNGKWHIIKISNATLISRETVSKYIKEYEKIYQR